MATNNSINNNIASAVGSQIGTNTNDNAPIGHVGEYLSDSVLVGDQIPLISGVNSNICTLNLSSGDWNVQGIVFFNRVVEELPNIEFFECGISTTSEVFPIAGSENNYAVQDWNFNIYHYLSMGIGPTRISISITTPVYLVVQCTYEFSNINAFGFLSARRAR